jgi:hypothetical protein
MLPKAPKEGLALFGGFFGQLTKTIQRGYSEIVYDRCAA